MPSTCTNDPAPATAEADPEQGSPALQVFALEADGRAGRRRPMQPGGLTLAASALALLGVWLITGDGRTVAWSAAALTPAVAGCLWLCHHHNLLESELHQAVICAHRSRLDPHFVLNAINAALPAGRAAEASTGKLQAYFRYVHRHRDFSLVALAAEYAFAGELLDLESARFGDRLVVSRRLDPSVGAAMVPALLLQPLVENAVKYGEPGVDERTHVHLTVSRDGDLADISLANTGAWLRASANPEGFGLELVRQLLAAQWPERHSFVITSGEGWVRLRLRFPLDSSSTSTARLPAP